MNSTLRPGTGAPVDRPGYDGRVGEDGVVERVVTLLRCPSVYFISRYILGVENVQQMYGL